MISRGATRAAEPSLEVSVEHEWVGNRRGSYGQPVDKIAWVNIARAVALRPGSEHDWVPSIKGQIPRDLGTCLGPHLKAGREAVRNEEHMSRRAHVRNHIRRITRHCVLACGQHAGRGDWRMEIEVGLLDDIGASPPEREDEDQGEEDQACRCPDCYSRAGQPPPDYQEYGFPGQPGAEDDHRGIMKP
jgi:hypothetical protein